MLQAVKNRFGDALKDRHRNRIAQRRRFLLHCRGDADILKKGGPETHHDAGQKSAGQRDGRMLHQNDDERLRLVDAQAGRENGVAKPGHRV
jgi:hypothetical protein